MRKSVASGLLGTAAVLGAGHSTWAQAVQAAEPVEPAAMNPLTLLGLLTVPVVFIFLIMWSIVTTRKVQRKNLGQIDRSLAMAEENSKLLREQVALQVETNRLLAELVDKFRRPE